jgi:hypothetical protein
MEANSKALFRLMKAHGPKTLKPKAPTDLLGIVDVGHSWATISFYTFKGSSVFSRTVSYRKVDDGPESKQKDLLPAKAAELISSTIKESVLYFEEKGNKIALIALSGVEATHQTVLDSVAGLQKQIIVKPIGQIIRMPNASPEQVHTFGAAIGAATRSTHLYRYSYQHNFIK